MFRRISLKAGLYILLLAYIVFIVSTTMRVKDMMNFILSHPVRVTQETREMKTRLREMQNTMPGLLSSPDLSQAAKMDLLEAQEQMQDNSLERVKNLYTGNRQKILDLEEEFARIRRLRRKAVVALADNADFDVAMEYYHVNMDAPDGSLYNAINALFLVANSQMEETRERVDDDARLNVMLTLFLGILLAAAFVYVEKKDRGRVSQLAAREKLFNQLSQNVNEVFIIARDSRHFDYVSANSERLLGLNYANVCANPDVLYAFLPEADAGWLKEELDGAQEAPHGDRVVTLGSGGRIFRLGVYPISRGESEANTSLVVLRDDTEALQQQQALSDALENAHAASAAKSSFLSHMSHEIRTPMNAIIGMTTIALSRIGDTPRVQDCLAKIAESSRHLLGLINDVLDMSKIENGKLCINHEPLELKRTVQSLANLVRPQAAARELDFEILMHKVVVEKLVGDALRLNQILLNILSNALKFTPPHGKIVLKIEQVSKSSQSVLLRFIISDTGIGMSEEFLQRIYQPFEQASASTTTKYGGTGLGMSITFNLISLMGGTISVSSKEGVGTTFTVELPFGLSEESASDFPASLPPLKVLVVDDDPGTCEHASLLLEKMGLKVRWTLSGEEAVEMVRKAREAGDSFDICFIDWQMPGIDGADTARRIRKDVGDDMLIIIISAYDWTPIEQEARAAGVNDFIAKPFFASTLYDALVTSSGRLGHGAHAEASGLAGTNGQSVPAAANKPEYDFSGRRILLAEDNEFNREIAEEFLSMVHAEVEHAANGQEAVDKFIASAPGYYDLVLMDVQMPIMDGYEATRKIRASDHPDASSIRIVAMTANAFSEDVANAVAAGMNGHIAKPIDIKALYSTIAAHMPAGKRKPNEE